MSVASPATPEQLREGSVLVGMRPERVTALIYATRSDLQSVREPYLRDPKYTHGTWLRFFAYEEALASALDGVETLREALEDARAFIHDYPLGVEDQHYEQRRATILGAGSDSRSDSAVAPHGPALAQLRQAIGSALTITRGGTVQMPKAHWDAIGAALALGARTASSEPSS